MSLHKLRVSKAGEPADVFVFGLSTLKGPFGNVSPTRQKEAAFLGLELKKLQNLTVARVGLEYEPVGIVYRRVQK